MADDDRERRRKVAAAAFAARRGELGMTQQDVAAAADVAVKTVHNFESAGRWPNSRTRRALERAVRWASDEITRRAAPPKPDLDPSLQARLETLTDAQRAYLIEWLTERLSDGADLRGQRPELPEVG